jgi:hypothetical protein
MSVPKRPHAGRAQSAHRPWIPGKSRRSFSCSRARAGGLERRARAWQARPSAPGGLYRPHFLSIASRRALWIRRRPRSLLELWRFCKTGRSRWTPALQDGAPRPRRPGRRRDRPLCPQRGFDPGNRPAEPCRDRPAVEDCHHLRRLLPRRPGVYSALQPVLARRLLKVTARYRTSSAWPSPSCGSPRASGTAAPSGTPRLGWPCPEGSSASSRARPASPSPPVQTP